MRTRALLAVMLLALAPAVAAQQADQAELDVGPGLVSPNSLLYGLETAWDNAAVSVGLKKAGTVAQERAAEARQMQERNNTRAMRRAVNQLNKVAKKAKSGDTEGLRKAASVLQAVMERAPEEAQQGLQTALNNVQGAMERAGGAPDNGSAGPGGQVPDGVAPGGDGSGAPDNATGGPTGGQQSGGMQNGSPGGAP